MYFVERLFSASMMGIWLNLIVDEDSDQIEWETLEVEANPINAYKRFIFEYYSAERPIEKEDLAEALAVATAVLDETFEESKPVNNLFILAIAVAVPVLVNFLGADWVQRNTALGFGSASQLRKMVGIMRLQIENYVPQVDESDEAYKRTTRTVHHTIELAEALYNFQNLPGFRAKLQEFRAGREHTEDIFAEFQAAQILVRRGAYLEFVNSSGQNHKGYDVNAVLPNGTRVACEIKSRREDNKNFNLRVLRNKLRNAITQLPINMPTLIIVKIPEHFDSTATLLETFGDFLLNDFFMYSGAARVSGVVLLKDRYVTEGNKYAYMHNFVHVENPNANYPLSNIAQISEISDTDERWQHFHQILGIDPFGHDMWQPS